MGDLLRTRRRALVVATVAALTALAVGLGAGSVLAANGGPVHAGPTTPIATVSTPIATATGPVGTSTLPISPPAMPAPAVHATGATETHAHLCQVDDVVTLTLKGTVNPGRSVTRYHFVYGPTAAYGHSTPVRTLGAGAGSTSVSARTGSVSDWRTFHYALVATNATATITGADTTHTFEVFPCPLERMVRLGVRAVARSGGAVRLTFTAPAGESGQSWDALVAVTTRAGTSLGESSVRVGTLVTGRSRALTVHLSSAGASLLKRDRRLSVRVEVRAGSSSNLNSVTRLALTLQ